MSLDLYLEGPPEKVECRCDHCDNVHTRERREQFFSTNITHNLHRMFDEAGVGDILWNDNQGLIAGDCIPALREALWRMKAEPERFKAFDSPNGWGLYKHALPWLEEVLEAFQQNPKAEVRCWR